MPSQLEVGYARRGGGILPLRVECFGLLEGHAAIVTGVRVPLTLTLLEVLE